MLEGQDTTHPECSGCPDTSGTLLSDGIQLSTGVAGCMALLGSGPASVPVKGGQLGVVQSPNLASTVPCFCRHKLPRQVSGPMPASTPVADNCHICFHNVPSSFDNPKWALGYGSSRLPLQLKEHPTCGCPSPAGHEPGSLHCCLVLRVQMDSRGAARALGGHPGSCKGRQLPLICNGLLRTAARLTSRQWLCPVAISQAWHSSMCLSRDRLAAL